MAHHGKSSIEVDATAEDLFAIVADLDSYPEWLTDIKEVEVLETGADGYPLAAEMVVDVKIREVRYILEYDWNHPDSVSWTSRPGGDVKLIEGSYTFDITDDGATSVVYELAIDPGFPVPGFMVKRAANHITAQALDGLKARAEAG